MELTGIVVLGLGLPLPDPADTASFFPPSPGLPAHRVERSCWIYCISLNSSLYYSQGLSLCTSMLPDLVFSWTPPSFPHATETDSILSTGLVLESFMIYELLVDIDRYLQVFCYGTQLSWQKISTGKETSTPFLIATLVPNTESLMFTAHLGQLVGSSWFHLQGMNDNSSHVKWYILTDIDHS